MARIITENKELIQSYIFTAAKYDFTAYEKRIMYRLVECAQKEIEGIKIKAVSYTHLAEKLMAVYLGGCCLPVYLFGKVVLQCCRAVGHALSFCYHRESIFLSSLISAWFSSNTSLYWRPPK